MAPAAPRSGPPRAGSLTAEVRTPPSNRVERWYNQVQLMGTPASVTAPATPPTDRFSPTRSAGIATATGFVAPGPGPAARAFAQLTMGSGFGHNPNAGLASPVGHNALRQALPSVPQQSTLGAPFEATSRLATAFVPPQPRLAAQALSGTASTLELGSPRSGAGRPLFPAGPVAHDNGAEANNEGSSSSSFGCRDAYPVRR